MSRAGAVHLFGGSSSRHPGPRRGAPSAVSPRLALVLELFEDQPDGLVADTRHGRPDVRETERDGCAAQAVNADALLLAEPGPWIGGIVVPVAGGFEERLVVGGR